MSLTDQQLLQDYAEHRSETAFAKLVRRHIDPVHSAAVRMVCDSHLAQDVTQRVFVALARQAAQLSDRVVLSGWLHRTARNIAAETVRADVRRRAREQEAAAMNDSLAAEPDALWEHVAPHLDTALEELPEPDRDAVLLRYFDRKSAREMAQTLGLSEEAAQRRVSRAVERLRALFAKRGISVGAGGLVVVISAHAVQAAPAGLAAAVSAAAVTATAASAGAAVGLLKVITMTKLQAAVIGAIALGVVVTPLVLRHQTELRRENESLRQQLAQIKSDNEGLAGQVVELKSAAASASAAAAIAASTPTNALALAPPFQQVTQFLMAHYQLPREQVEAYLAQNHRNVESLFAAFQVSRDLSYLREAATNSPADPAVQCAVIANKLYPEEQRKWIDAFKASSAENALPWYFSALDDFKAKQPDQAVQELNQAGRRQFYADYAAQTCQAVEEMYASAGWPALAAKAGAPGTASSSLPMVLKDLANEALQTQQACAGRGDASAANSMASLGMGLGDQLRRNSGPLTELVGIAIQKKILAQLDPSGSYDFLGRPITELQAELDRQKASIREALQVRDELRPTLDETELNNYWEREKIYGEMYALQWLQSKHRQP
jgi:RNA polymerase sigma factor (sigma-70 family)